MKVLAVLNSSAGFGDGAFYDFLRLLMQDGDEACLRVTDGTTPVEKLLGDAPAFDAVVVSGGDGTLAAASYALAYTDVPIIPYPGGTANLLAGNLLSPLEPHSLAEMARRGDTLDFDIGEIEAGGRRFGFQIMAGAGYDATIMQEAQRNKKLLGPLAYFQAAVTNALPQKSRIRLTIDGETVETEGLGVILVNFSHIQFEIPITHGANARDGSFDVAVLKAENAFGLIPALLAGIKDREGNYPQRSDSMEVYRGSEIEVVADPPLSIEYDGEPIGLSTPFKARVMPRAVRFVLGPEAVQAFGDPA